MGTVQADADDWTDEDRRIDASVGQTALVRPKPAARLLGISIASFYRFARDGRIETVGHGDGSAVRRAHLRHLMRRGVPSSKEIGAE
jgi:hypothetical protein